MSSVLNLISTCINASVNLFGMTLITGFVVGTLAFRLKPDGKMLEKEINSHLTEKIQNQTSSGSLQNIVGLVAPTIITKTFICSMKDYIFFLIANVVFADGSKQKYIGYFGLWKPISNNFNL